jgi:hypothetical protein
MTVYLATPVDAMRALDAERFHAEQFSTEARVWDMLAARYEGQGRSAQAASCRRRAAHYAQVFPVAPGEHGGVAVETEVCCAGD